MKKKKARIYIVAWMFNQKKELNYNKERKKIKGKFIKKKFSMFMEEIRGKLKYGNKILLIILFLYFPMT